MLIMGYCNLHYISQLVLIPTPVNCADILLLSAKLVVGIYVHIDLVICFYELSSMFIPVGVVCAVACTNMNTCA